MYVHTHRLPDLQTPRTHFLVAEVCYAPTFWLSSLTFASNHTILHTWTPYSCKLCGRMGLQTYGPIQLADSQTRGSFNHATVSDPVAGSWTFIHTQAQNRVPHPGKQEWNLIRLGAGHGQTIVLTRQLSTCDWSFLFPYHSIFLHLFLPKSPKSIHFHAFGSSPNNPIGHIVQSHNVSLLLGSNCP